MDFENTQKNLLLKNEEENMQFHMQTLRCKIKIKNKYPM